MPGNFRPLSGDFRVTEDSSLSPDCQAVLPLRASQSEFQAEISGARKFPMGVRKFPSCKIKIIAKLEAELVLPSVEDPSELLAEISVARKFPVASPEISSLQSGNFQT